MKLKPCPFCGSDAEEQWHPYAYVGVPHLTTIWCTKCQATTSTYQKKVDAIVAWNERIKEEL